MRNTFFSLLALTILGCTDVNANEKERFVTRDTDVGKILEIAKAAAAKCADVSDDVEVNFAILEKTYRVKITDSKTRLNAEVEIARNDLSAADAKCSELRT